MTPFVTGFMRLLLSTFKDTIAVLQRKEDQLETYKAKVDKFITDDELLQNIYYILLQAALFYGQGVPMAQLVKITDKSQKTIKTALNQYLRNIC